MHRAVASLPLMALLVALALPTGSDGSDATGLTCPGSLAGTWYVFVHYRDVKSQHPQRVHWSDRVWTLQVTPEAVTWTDYPDVVFDHSEGRFAGGPSSGRRLPDWLPDPAQLAEIRRGLTVNARPAVKKSLLPQAGGRWSSAKPGKATPGFVTYEQDWTIARKGATCVLTQTDVFGAGGGADEGTTRYRISTRGDGGSLQGSYERDGHLEGAVRLLASGPVRPRKSGAPPGITHGRSPWPPPR